jgi:hypothetical protein
MPSAWRWSTRHGMLIGDQDDPGDAPPEEPQWDELAVSVWG